MPDSFLDAALEYARRGWPVFPLIAREKRPIMAGGFHKATTDEAEIRKWWTRWPNANIGIPAGPSTFCVVDADPLHGGDLSLKALCEEHGSIPTTLIQISGSDGCHYCFKPDPRVGNTESVIGPGIDTRGNGKGYIVVAPSIHPKTGRAYRWDNPGTSLADIPEWLIPHPQGATALPAPSECDHEPPIASDSGKSCRTDSKEAVPWNSVYSEQEGIEARARAYLRQCEPAIQGQGGHSKLLWACTAMVHGYELDDNTAFRLLADEYNPICSPPWNLGDPKELKEFRRKIEEGHREKRKPRGWLLEEYNRDQAILAEHGRRMADALIASVTTKKAPAPTEDAKPIRVAIPPIDAPRKILSPVGLLGDLCGWINSKARKLQPLLTLANALAFLGALFGRKIRDEWDLRTNIYCLGVGAAACGKDHSRRAIKDLCAAAGIATDLLGGEEATSDASIASALRERLSCLCQWDEVGHMIASMKDKYASPHRKTIVPMLMKLYSSANTVYLGKEYACEDRQDLDQPCLCIYGTTVPDTLWKGLTTDELRDGFLSRLIVFISTDDDPEINDAGSRIASIPTHLVERIVYWFQFKPPAPKGTPDIKAQTGTWQLTVPTEPSANERFIALRQYVRNQRKKAAEDFDASSFLWGRAEENARKIALIVAAADAPNAEEAKISIVHADYACALIEYLLAEFVKAVGDNIADSKTELTIKRVLKWVRETGESGLWRNNINNRIRNPRERNEAIEDLLKEGEIFEVTIGRKRVYFAPPYGMKYLEEKTKQRKAKQ